MRIPPMRMTAWKHAALVACMLTLSSASAWAGTITWAVSGTLKASGCGACLLSGSFEFDGANVANWQFSGFVNMTGAGATFSSPVAISGFPAVQSTLRFQNTSGDIVSLGLDIASLSTFATPGTMPFITGVSGTSPNLNYPSFVEIGSAKTGFRSDGPLDGTADPTPEPAAGALVGTGALLLLGLAWRRRSALTGYTER